MVPGVTRPDDTEGVIRPEGVTRPFDIETEGVTRPLDMEVESEGVTRPGRDGVIRPREDATDEGR